MAHSDAGDAAGEPALPALIAVLPGDSVAGEPGEVPEAATAASQHHATTPEAVAAKEAPPADRRLVEAAAAEGSAPPAATPAGVAEAVAKEASTAAAVSAVAAPAAAEAMAAKLAASTPAPRRLQALPAWALALLGVSMACAAVVQLWHLLPHAGLLCRAASEDVAGATRGPGSPQPLRVSVPSVDVEGAEDATPGRQAEGEPASPTAPASVAPPVDKRAGNHTPPRQAAVQGSTRGPRQSGPTGPPPLGVDPSVASRDLARLAWVPTDPRQAPRRLSEFHNPLYGSDGGSPAAAGAATEDLGGSWRAKAAASVGAQQGEAGSEAGGDDFRLLAAALPGPGGGEAWEAAGHQAALPSAGAASSSGSATGSAADLPAPGSPSKRAAKALASRKLTAAKSVGPQELPALVEGEVEAPVAAAAGSAHTGPASSAAGSAEPRGRASTAGSSLQPEPSTGSAVHSAARAAVLQTPGATTGATPSVRMLTAQQFRASASWGGWWASCTGAWRH